MKKSPQPLWHLATALFLVLTAGCTTQDNPHPLKIWYEHPAGEWTEALPVGNGRLAAMVFGNPNCELIQLNEESLWAGSKMNNNNQGALHHLPEIRKLLFEGEIEKALLLAENHLLGTPPGIRSYQPLGDLRIDLQLDTAGITGYQRELDMDKGTAVTRFRCKGTLFQYEVFSSAPDNSIVVILTTENGKMNPVIQLLRERDATVRASGNSLLMDGQINDPPSFSEGPGGPHMKFAARLIISETDGFVKTGTETLEVADASKIVLLLTAATNFNLQKLDLDSAIDPAEQCNQILGQAADNSAAELRERHIRNHQALFKRTELRLCQEHADTIPTHLRLKRVQEGKEDLHLTELYFQYGRYLLMSCSRFPGLLPANLQGKWNPLFQAPWDSDYHTNINLQMNYWPADVCNLPETLDPLFSFINSLTIPGSVTAREMYGAKGWTLHHATDPFGRTGLMDGIQWGTFPMAGPWLALHFWDHYLFTCDTAWLRKTAWPVMQGSARFLLDFLTYDPKGRLVTAPSYSPENAYYLPGTKIPMQLTYGASMDIQIASELLQACLKATAAMNSEKSFADSLRFALDKLPPIQTGTNGTLMEWIEDYEEAEPGHRHISHLFALHPGTQITPQTPGLYAAARKTVERRLNNGGGQTGWSRAWIINFYARLHDGREAHRHLMELLGKSTLSNLFDTHPPFQIDGNFGGTAGIAEMLVQSHGPSIELLPALPQSWNKGYARGLMARGGFEINMEWDNGILQEVMVTSKTNRECNLVYGDKKTKFLAKKGHSYTFAGDLE